MELDGKTSEVVIRLGKPRIHRFAKSKHRIPWVCPFQISGIGTEEPFYAEGADGFQALIQALIGIRKYLDRTGGLFSGWIDNGYAGFPKLIHEGWGLDFIQNCEALLDAEHAKRMEEIEQRKLANPAYLEYVRSHATPQTPH